MRTETKSVGGYVRIENNFEKALATLQLSCVQYSWHILCKLESSQQLRFRIRYFYVVEDYVPYLILTEQLVEIISEVNIYFFICLQLWLFHSYITLLIRPPLFSNHGVFSMKIFSKNCSCLLKIYRGVLEKKIYFFYNFFLKLLCSFYNFFG